MYALYDTQFRHPLFQKRNKIGGVRRKQERECGRRTLCFWATRCEQKMCSLEDNIKIYLRLVGCDSLTVHT